MPDPLPITAEQIIAQAEEAGQDVLEALGQMLKQMVIADIPKGDPAVDPDPSYSLADHVEVRRYGNTVSVSVEGPYAVRVHEDMQAQHPRGGSPKYLERNATALVRQLEERLAGELVRKFSGTQRRSGGAASGFTTDLR